MIFYKYVCPKEHSAYFAKVLKHQRWTSYSFPTESNTNLEEYAFSLLTLSFDKEDGIMTKDDIPYS
jgi:hypothetical protein